MRHLANEKTLRKYRDSIGAPWFDDAWDLNMVILRSGNVGQFDDLAVLACRDDAGREVIQTAVCTADAWPGEWEDPTHPDGCVYILDQHVPQAYILGVFKTRTAFRQHKPFRCVRWNPSDGMPDVRLLEQRGRTHGFTDNRGTHYHNLFTRESPAIPPRDSSEGCGVSLHRHEHAAMMELGFQQKHLVGSPLISCTWVQAVKVEQFSGRSRSARFS